MQNRWQKYRLFICIQRLPLKTARGKIIFKNDYIPKSNTLNFPLWNSEVSQFWLDNLKSSLTFLSTHSFPSECDLLHIKPGKLRWTCSYLTFQHISINWPENQTKLNQNTSKKNPAQSRTYHVEGMKQMAKIALASIINKYFKKICFF